MDQFEELFTLTEESRRDQRSGSPRRPRQSSRSRRSRIARNDAWTQRLNAMAIDYQKEQARQKRADAASSQRLTKLAEFIRNGGHAY